MKIFTFLFFIIFTSITTNAQITKGNWMVGGDASFSNSNFKDENGESQTSSTGIRIYPTIGYFFATKLAGGLNANFYYGNPSNATSNFGFGIGPFMRYYFFKPDKLINIFIDGSYNFYNSKTSGNSFRDASNYRFKAGPVLYFNSSVGLECTLSYSSSKFDTYTSNELSVNLGFQIHLEK